MTHNSAYYDGYSAELLAIADQMGHQPCAAAYRRMSVEYAWMGRCVAQLEFNEALRKAADAAAALVVTVAG